MDTAPDDGSITVVVPTFREVENIPILVPQVAEALAKAGLRGEILIVDDNSNDGTEAVCKQLAATYPVRLVVRTQERGLSSAVLHGMRQATGSIFVVMDADLSHPPEMIPHLIEALQAENTEFVIGSRYVSGGGTDENWGLFRWLNSKCATLLAWPLTSAHDPMAGFFALRRSTFENAATLDPIGYKIGLELIVKCKCRKIREVPIAFRDRVHGTSKLNFKEQVNYLRHLRRLYEHKFGIWMQALQFALVGGTGVVVDFCCFTLLLMMLPEHFSADEPTWLEPEYVARGLAIWVAMTWNFFLNRTLTFSRARDRTIFAQYGLFCLTCLMGAIVNWGTFVALRSATDLFDERRFLAFLLGVLAGTVFNFLFSKHLVFK